MKLVPDAITNLSITSIGHGWIEINGVKYKESLLLTSSGITKTLPVSRIEDLLLQDFQYLSELSIDIALVGTGVKQLFIQAELLSPLMINGVGFETMDTAAACRTFNVLASEGRQVGAILFVNPMLD